MAKPSKSGTNTKPIPSKMVGARAAKGSRTRGRVGGAAKSKPKAGAAARALSAAPAPDVTFREFQQLIRDRYFATDSARGVPGTFMWLIEEVGELATSLQDNAPGKTPTAADRANLVEEFADVIAWLTTLANIANVDLAQALTKYTDLSRVKGVKS